MVPLVFGRFFYFRPVHLFPVADRFLVSFQGTSHGPLAAPSQPPQNAPHMDVRIPNPALALDQIGHPPAGPQPGFIS